MKTLFDGIEVSERSYYYLLDWNESDKRIYINEQFNKNRLCDLTIKEYTQLFSFASQIDLIYLRDKLIENNKM